MKKPEDKIITALTRRQFLQNSLALGLILGCCPLSVADNSNLPLILKNIPKTGEQIPAIGMGNWISFNVGDNVELRNHRSQIRDTFLKMGGTMVDSSPMYGSAEEVIGYALKRTKFNKQLFSATKVWTPFKKAGKEQIQSSFDLWGIKQFDLFQVHNLLSWETHLETLQEMKQQGRIRYVGITTSHGRRHEELEQIIKTQDIDFVQLTYNIVDREVEERLLPAALDKGVAVIANRPFQGGDLFSRFQHQPLPDWVKAFDCDNWAQFFLKFIISHPAITCAIPATTQLPHLIENMGALYGALPEPKMRQRMIAYIEQL